MLKQKEAEVLRLKQLQHEREIKLRTQAAERAQSSLALRGEEPEVTYNPADNYDIASMRSDDSTDDDVRSDLPLCSHGWMPLCSHV